MGGAQDAAYLQAKLPRSQTSIQPRLEAPFTAPGADAVLGHHHGVTKSLVEHVHGPFVAIS
jgi:hypothetical protein